MNFIYVLQCGIDQIYKIGITNDIPERIKTLQIGCPFELSLVMMCRMGSLSAAKLAESQIHRHLDGCCVRGEWFQLDSKQLAQLQLDMITNES